MGWVMAAAATVSAVSGGIKAIKASKQAKEASQKAATAKLELDKQKDAFRSLDTSNPYSNMENTMDDLTVNQKEAEFTKQQQMQSQGGLEECILTKNFYCMRGFSQRAADPFGGDSHSQPKIVN